MFNELKELLQTRDIVLTLSAVDDTHIRVTVNPKPKDKETKEKDEAKILSTPFVLEGSADELDAEFAKTVAEYKSTVLSTEDSIAAIKAEAEAEVKAVKADAAQKVKDAKKSATPVKFGTTAKQETAKKVEPPAPPSLFDTPPVPIPETKATTSAPAAELNVNATLTFPTEDTTNDYTQEVDEDGSEDQLATA